MTITPQPGDVWGFMKMPDGSFVSYHHVRRVEDDMVDYTYGRDDSPEKEWRYPLEVFLHDATLIERDGKAVPHE